MPVLSYALHYVIAYDSLKASRIRAGKDQMKNTLKKAFTTQGSLSVTLVAAVSARSERAIFRGEPGWLGM